MTGADIVSLDEHRRRRQLPTVDDQDHETAEIIDLD
jgi:hypothetical protein